MRTRTRLHWNAPQAQDHAQLFGEVMVIQMVVLGVDTRDLASLDQGITLKHAETGSTVKY